MKKHCPLVGYTKECKEENRECVDCLREANENNRGDD